MKPLLFAKSLAVSMLAMASAGLADTEQYLLASKWSQIVFSYDHLGFSRTTGMLSGIEGEILFDADHPEKSNVSVTVPVSSLHTGLPQRDTNFIAGGDFFSEADVSLVSFTSTHIEVTGEVSASITGNLTLNGITKPVTLDAELNKIGFHNKEQKDWLGFDATASLLRSEFGLGKYAPGVSDEVNVYISIEAMKSE
ncbi:polyisoprenoid-binding protein [Phaeobacter inhibens]|uniref:YceI family protein n=1 Tax=Phaeobacter inhibens TaxID=221822 RepID=UPI00275621C9|nr:YceI family protein [Phaeobacter inhibens]GLO69961.1 polyisoprenoid-binding protein [Phaeobacter inhibens]